MKYIVKWKLFRRQEDKVKTYKYEEYAHEVH